MQTVKKTPYELDDIALLHLLVPLSERESQPLQSVSIAQTIETDNDPIHLTPQEADEIFHLAEAEIQPLLQPLLRKARIERWRDRILAVCCLCMILAGIAGTIYQVITYPHTLVVLYAKEKPASITTTLDLPTRTLAPVTIARDATAPTTGHGHQDARVASGTLTFYNGSYVSQTINAGTVYTGRDGVQVALSQTVTIPAAIPPQFGEATVSAQALNTGIAGNIQAFDITLALSNFLTAKNLSPFTGGRDARDYQAVAKRDLSKLTSTLQQTLTQAVPQAFVLRRGEALHTTTCQFNATANYQTDEEAHTVTMKAVDTCQGIAYSQRELITKATAAFTATRPSTQYRIVGQVKPSIITVSPFTVHLTGAWAFVLTKDNEQYLAEKIAGDSPDQARKVLQQTGIIAYASIPSTLPPAEYIDFFVLVGK